MRAITQAFWEAQEADRQPLVLALLTSNMTRRLYAMRLTSDTEQGGSGGITLYDGANTYGDDTIYGSAGMLADSGPRVVSFGGIRETLAPENNALLASLNQTEIGSYSIELDNIDGHFSDILQTESFLNNDLEVLVGFRGLAFSDFKSLFTGTIIEETLSIPKLSLLAQGNLDFKVIQANTPLSQTPYALETTGFQVGATDNIAFATLSPIFFTSASWSIVTEFRRDVLGQGGIIFNLVNDDYSFPRVEVGIDIDDHPYVIISRDLETGDNPTYTSAITLDSDDLDRHLVMSCVWDNTAGELTITFDGQEDIIDVSGSPNGFDREYEGFGTDDLNIGYQFAGAIHSLAWGSTWKAINDTGTTLPTDFPDAIGTLDIPIDEGAWVKW